MVVKKEINFLDKYIKWFSDIHNKDIPLVGGKGASLGEMYNNKFPVPPGFVITAQAFGIFIENIKEDIKKILFGTDFENTDELDKKSKEIRTLIEKEHMPDELKTEILEAYKILGTDKINEKGVSMDALNILRNSQEPIFVSVRSSATTEDLANASFAGQHESFLNVKGETELIEFVKKCFSSLYTPRAIYYRNKKGFEEGQSLLAVIVQKMIDSEKSGVVFSKDPMTLKNRVVVEAVFGLGEGIVSGQIKPDYYIVEDSEIKDIQVADKKIAIVRTGSGVNGVAKLSHDKSHSQVLTNREIMEIANYALKLEEHYKKPQDIEFCIENNKMYIVQSRPITTKGQIRKTEINGTVLLSGLGASPGIGVGIVKIINSMKDLPKIQKGDVLVTEMTNPDMVVAMQKSAAIVTDEGGMTCFSGDTNVLTTRGFMTIRDTCEIINNNEDLGLLSFNSKEMVPVWKRIIATGKKKSNMVKISVSQKGLMEDNTIDLTSNHKFITFNNRELIKKQISDVLENEEMICLIDKLPLTSNLYNPKKAYLLGALLSDGYHKVTMHHTGNPRRGCITFTQKEIPEKKEFIETVKEYFKEIFNEEFIGRECISNSYLRGRHISGIATHFTSTKLAPALEISKISQNLDKWALCLDKISSLNFLAGLIDGDGCLFENRIHLYISKENILQGTVLACLNLGIFPQVTRNRNIYHVQILERLSDILQFTKRVKGIIHKKVMGNKLFSAKQILLDIIDKINLNGKIKPYVDNNLLIDSNKINRLFNMCDEKIKERLMQIINSGLRMQRVKKICDIGEDYVYNLEVEADNELDHNFIVFTKKYTPLLVSNSHASIVSREMGIPAVVGTGNATKILKDGMKITIDGFEGKIYEGEVAETKLTEVKPIVQTKTKLKLILDLPDFAERAVQSGIDAVGLQRLEGIIATMGKHPLQYEKENNLENYTEILKKGIEKISKHFKLIWIRTSDIRTDEFSSLKGAPAREINPMLGNHGIRFSLKHPHIFKAELRAIQEVAEKYPDKKFGVMCPQIILIEEVKQAKKLFEEFKTSNMEFGVMIETPAAVQIIDDICKEVKFVSLGTNDLTQFTLAVDRGEDSVQDLYNELNPAIFSEIKKVLDSCVKHRVKSSICGQAGSKKEMAEFLLKNKIDSISVNADAAHDISVFIKGLEDNMDSSSSLEDEDARVEEIDNQESQISQTLHGMRKEQIVVRKENPVSNNINKNNNSQTNNKNNIIQQSGSNSNNRERNWQNRMRKKLIKQWANPELHYQVSQKISGVDNLNRIDKKILEIKQEVRQEKAEKLAENKVIEDEIETTMENSSSDESYGDEENNPKKIEKGGSGDYNSKESYGDEESEMSF